MNTIIPIPDYVDFHPNGDIMLIWHVTKIGIAGLWFTGDNNLIYTYRLEGGEKHHDLIPINDLPNKFIEIAELLWLLSKNNNVNSYQYQLKQVIDSVILNNPAKVDAFKSGEKKLIGWFVGQVMKHLGGKSNPNDVFNVLAYRLTWDYNEN